MHETPALPKESNAKAVSPGVPRANRSSGEVGKIRLRAQRRLRIGRRHHLPLATQDRIDHGEKPGATSTQNTELAAARKRIRELEHELELVRKAAAIFDEQEKIRPKGSTR